MEGWGGVCMLTLQVSAYWTDSGIFHDPYLAKTFFISVFVSVSGLQNANRYRYLEKLIFDMEFNWVNPIHHLSAP